MVMSVLAIPQGVGFDAAIAALRSQFPGAVTSPNTLYDPGAGRAYGAALIKWRILSKGCGRNVRIGIIDSDIAPGAPSLRGRKVQNRSFSVGLCLPPIMGRRLRRSSSATAGTDP